MFFYICGLNRVTVVRQNFTSQSPRLPCTQWGYG